MFSGQYKDSEEWKKTDEHQQTGQNNIVRITRDKSPVGIVNMRWKINRKLYRFKKGVLQERSISKFLF